LRQWPMDSPEAKEVRNLYLSDKSDRSDNYAFKTASAEVAANTLICLINQASSLLGRQIRQLEEDFLANGGLRERMTKARLESRALMSDMSDRSDLSDKVLAPSCPKCGKPMRQRTARTGPNTGKSFWGCTSYPECKGIKSIDT